MLAPSERVKEFLLHPEKVLREHAARYFKESFSTDPDLASLILQSCKIHGEANNRFLLACAVDFIQSESTVQTVLAQLPQVTDSSVMLHYNKIIANADVDILTAMDTKIRKTTNVTPGCLNKIKRRLSFSSMSTAELVDHLLAFSFDNEDKNLYEVDYDYGKDIVKTLASRDDLPIDTILTILTNENYQGYEELYMISLAGQLKLAEVIPLLIDNLRTDEEVLTDESVEALIRIGNEIVIRGIQRCFANEDWGFRLCAASVFGGIKSPASDKAFSLLLPEEPDSKIQTVLAYEWCHLLSDSSIPQLKKLIHSGYDRQFANIEEGLYCVCKMTDTDLPELEEWRKEIEKREKEFPRKQVDMIVNAFLQNDPIMRAPDNAAGNGSGSKKSKKVKKKGKR